MVQQRVACLPNYFLVIVLVFLGPQPHPQTEGVVAAEGVFREPELVRDGRRAPDAVHEAVEGEIQVGGELQSQQEENVNGVRLGRASPVAK